MVYIGTEILFRLPNAVIYSVRICSVGTLRSIATMPTPLDPLHAGGVREQSTRVSSTPTAYLATWLRYLSATRDIVLALLLRSSSISARLTTLKRC